ncbi:MAG: YfhO family protein [Vicinamibacteria bacterium]|nr:YfhO family protein [Vicinamibacteria bacterium]
MTPLRRTLAGAVIGSMTLLVFGPLLAGKVIFERDVYHLWHGQMEGIVRAVAEGGLPLWDPTVSFGEPLMELPAQLLYPFTWLGMIMSAGKYYSLSVLFHHLFGGLGMLLLLRALRASETACLLGTVLWMSSGPWLSTANMLNLFTGTSWIPWMMLAAERTATHPTVRSALLWGASVAACLLTCSEPVFMGGLLAGVWYLFRFLQLRGSVPRYLILGSLALTTAILLSAGQWFPLVGNLAGTARANLPENVRTYWSLHPLLLLQIPYPLFYRSLPFVWAESFDDFVSPLLHSVYAGIGPLVLAGIAVAGLKGRGRLLGAVFAASILFALGGYAPAYDLIADHTPILASLRFPVKAMLLASFVLSVLAALGWDQARQDWRRGRAAVAGFLLGLVVLCVIGVRLVGPLIASKPSFTDVLWSLAGFGPTVVIGAMMMYALSRMDKTLGHRLLLMACVALPTTYSHARLNEMAPEALLTYRPPMVDAFFGDGGKRLYFRTRDQDTPKVADLNRKAPPGFEWEVAVALSVKQILPPTASRIFGIRSSFDDDIKNVQTRYIRLLSQLLRDAHGTPGELRVMQAAGVTHMVTLDTKGTDALTLVHSERTLMGDMVYLYRVPGPLPWCFVVDGIRNVDNYRAAIDLAYSGYDLRSIAIDPEMAPQPPSGAGRGECSVEVDGTSRTVATITSPRDGLAVFLDAWAPGWTATLDGQPAPVTRANLAFRGVAAPAGTHRVELRYRPQRLFVGLWISGLSLAAAVAAFIASAKRAKSADAFAL